MSQNAEVAIRIRGRVNEALGLIGKLMAEISHGMENPIGSNASEALRLMDKAAKELEKAQVSLFRCSKE